MFDVIWTDPNRELVGERMLRKEIEGKSKDKEKKKSQDGRQSGSTTGSSSSERAFGIFASKSRRKPFTTSKAKESNTNSAQLAGDDVKGNRNTAYAVKTLLPGQDEAEVAPRPIDGPFLPVQSPEACDASSSPSSRGLDSMVSKWTQQSATTNGVLAGASARDSIATSKSEHLVQTLGPSSFIIKSTEVSVSPRTPETDIDHLVSEIHISSDRTKPDTPPLPEVPEGGARMTFEEPGTIPPPYRLPQTPPPIEGGNYPGLFTSGYNSNERLGNPDAWKPPHEWDCTPTKQSASPSFDERLRVSPASPEADHYMSPDLLALQREVRMMAAASPELMLANMKSGMGEASDARVYRELEMARKRWMFSALHQHGGYAELAELVNNSPDSPTATKTPRILALYETQASASFLAALHPQVSISHLSPNPVSPNLFPNVQPILVPAISASAGSRSLPPQLYTTVSCLSMPALFPSTEIPPFLRHINRCLAPGGALHLTLIDPQPVSASMGPKLRNWLFEKLLINLEQMFRTTYPSGTFPAWLAVGRLRGRGSTIATVSVPAVTESLAKMAGVKESTRVTTELRCLVTRMLWQEVWGGFVHADRWWWEEEAIIKECTEMGTYWQYSHIVAVKEDR
ncbi:Uu.00g092900.m01.CDS01 [Anthostomella pinea]|uniref:Uu.00g092900.m01.CDS01 n=1 Tax=Anthostomella pinea TaxID=933095 RepID=A0AAI8VND9_9PEZI|nr:Uu.00g092900.m01.CDS01 [Anthostomella pinea]